MRKAAVTMAAIVVTGLVGAGLYAFVLHEEPLARGDLFQALVEEDSDDARELTDIFARFVPAAADLKEQAPVLLANGFRCSIHAANVGGSSYLTCDRPIEGTGYCRGFRYYSYLSRNGEIIETLGSVFNSERRRNILGRCKDNRQAFFDMAADLDENPALANR